MIDKILEITGKIFLSVILIFGSFAVMLGVIAFTFNLLNGFIK